LDSDVKERRSFGREGSEDASGRRNGKLKIASAPFGVFWRTLHGTSMEIYMKRTETVRKSRAKELLALVMVGDSMLTLVQPRRHMLLWTNGPDWWSRAVRPFAERPTMTRALGALGVGLGLWLASRQQK
jgi:hypothetical protein